jgi:small GTP-binding protein
MRLFLTFALLLVTCSRSLRLQLRSGGKESSSTLSSVADELGPQHDGFKSGFVSILGNPNVGKSSLLNALLQQKLCIVSPKPQTTRHRIMGVITEADYQIIFSDTPGMIRSPSYLLQENMMESVKSAAGDADVLVLVTDVYGENVADDRILQRLQNTTKPVLVAINKIDLQQDHDDRSNSTFFPPSPPDVAPDQVLSKKPSFFKRRLNSRQSIVEEKITAFQPPSQSGLEKRTNERAADIDAGNLVKEYLQRLAEEDSSMESSDQNDKTDPVSSSRTSKPLAELVSFWQRQLPRAEIITLSALNKTGVNTVRDRILTHLPKGPKYFPDDEVTTRDERFFASEIIRESLFSIYKDEVPYSCEVQIESFKDKNNLSVIEAVVIVSKASQKGIIIGNGGSRLKLLGVHARAQLEEFLARKVFLNILVKVDENWRSKPEALTRYGYKDADSK